MEMMEKKLFHACTTIDDSQNYLIECIKHNDLNEIKVLVEEDKIDINHCYGYPYYKPALSIACQWFSDTVSSDCIKKLLEYGADPSLEDDDEKSALNYAAESGNATLLEPILKNLKKNVDFNIEDSNVLLMLMDHIIRRKNKTESDYLEVIETLLDYGINVNKTDDEEGYSSIYLAAKYEFKQIIYLLLKHGPINLDKYKNEHTGKTARDLIVEKQLYPDDLPAYYEENDNVTIETLFKNLREKKNNEFKNNYNDIDQNLITQENKNKFLHRACDKGLDDIVKFLIEKGADGNSKINNESLLEKACDRGYFKIVKFLTRNNPNPVIVSNALFTLLKVSDVSKVTEDVNYNKCLDFILRYKDLQINLKDNYGKTALHLAAMYQDPEVTLKLLRKGASLACTDEFNVLPIADIDADTMRTHLDECMVEMTNCSNNDENKSITIKVTSLLPPRMNTETIENDENCKLQVHDDTPFVQNPSELLQEMNVLNYMSKSQELKHLLKHPVIMTFLFLKWYHIRLFFYINLGLYLTFFLSLLTYIMTGYKENSSHPTALYISYILLIITFLNIVVRELGQLIIYKTRYFLSFENWLEILLLLVTGTIIIKQNKDNTFQQSSSIAIVLAAIELLLLIGQFPSLSTNIMMLRTVSYTFFKLLLWYSILLLAFAFSFYNLFRESPHEQAKNETKTNDDDDEQDFFVDPGMSLLKTIVMLTGEFDAASIKFDSFPIVSHFIFVSFVFLITIVLFNLLNGLAVSDTQIIKNDAELYDQILRVEHISHLEQVLLQNRILKWIPYVKQICIFPSHIINTEIKIYENQRYKIVYGEYEESGQIRCYQCQEINLGRKIQKAIKNQLQEKREEELRKNKENDMARQLIEMREQLDNLKILLINGGKK